MTGQTEECARAAASSSGRVSRRALAWVFVLALSLRLIYLQEIHSLVFFDHLVGDAAGYDEWAQRIAAGDWLGTETFYQAPLYPYFLGLIYKVFGHDLWWVRVVQCALGSIGCVAIAMAGGLFLSARAGVVAGVIMALYPPAIYFDGILQKATLGVVLLAGLLWLLAPTERTKRWWTWLTVGLVLGLLALTRENLLVLTPVVMVWILLTSHSLGLHRTHGDRATRLGAWGAVTLVVVGLGFALLPVGYRNYRVGGNFVLTTYQMGTNFYMGNHAGADGRYAPLKPGREIPEYERKDATALAEQAAGRKLTPRQVSAFWMGQAWSYIGSQPLDWFRLLGTKWLLVWNRYEIPDTESYYIYRDSSWLLTVLGRIHHFGILCPLAVIGIVVTWPQRRRLWMFYLVALAIAASVTAFYVFGRYRFPLVPVLVIFAAAGLAEGWKSWRSSNQARAGAAIVLAALVAGLVNWPINPERHLNAAQLGNLGAALAEQQRLPEALVYFEQAVAEEPNAPRLRQFLAMALALSGRFEDAIPHYRAALDLEPERADADYNLAVALEQTGRFAEALHHYQQALEVDPSDEQAHRAIKRLRTGMDP